MKNRALPRNFRHELKHPQHYPLCAFPSTKTLINNFSKKIQPTASNGAAAAWGERSRGEGGPRSGGTPLRRRGTPPPHRDAANHGSLTRGWGEAGSRLSQPRGCHPVFGGSMYPPLLLWISETHSTIPLPRSLPPPTLPPSRLPGSLPRPPSPCPSLERRGRWGGQDARGPEHVALGGPPPGAVLPHQAGGRHAPGDTRGGRVTVRMGIAEMVSICCIGLSVYVQLGLGGPPSVEALPGPGSCLFRGNKIVWKQKKIKKFRKNWCIG